ncbi:bifunctional hydroxymethylpyrimidine kinase/phosphomethylpyrimidine kinase [Marinilactibacillus kalidii]|uniref:bifunctional hydroxymethylpyrimidine kinase/phosphomethylpyrimidine kinase n=1 Tax=Marinilactibacillus kalidii TaxID=2820274 RepID=UPI001ABDA927|nr:bifunctional hydroxymethylpyrimidine kinase/phosphomethylpyrimidine kinase [Marinilactibacillus kalidii]
MRPKQVLTIAGSDSGGGAGIQADLKTFQARGVFGTSVITAVTAQNTLGVNSVHPVPLEIVEAQLEAIFEDFDIAAIKTGMLVDQTYMELVAKNLAKHPTIPLIIDPVMIAKGGHPLMASNAIETMKTKLVPLADIITPNIPEAQALTGIEITDNKTMLEAARLLKNLGSRVVIIKGGHALEDPEATDLVLLESGEDVWLSTPRIDTKNTHGTGCTYSACITAEIAKEQDDMKAIQTAKAYIQAAIAQPLESIGHGHGPTNHWAYQD